MPGIRLTCVLLLAGLGAVTSVIGHETARPATKAHTSNGSGGSNRAGAAAPALRGAVLAALPDPAGFDVRAENRHRGTRDWRIARSRAAAAGLGLAVGTASVAPGEAVPLSIRGTGTARVRALRIGWYAGLGARQVWHGTVALGGAASGLGLPSDGWPPGHYLIRVDLGDATRAVPVTVRSPGLRGRTVLLVTSRTAKGFQRDDAGPVQQAERLGLRPAYLAAADVADDPHVLAGAAAVVTGGGSWPEALRVAVLAAARRGTNVAVLGAGGTAPAGLTSQRAGCPTAATPAGSWTVSDAAWWGYAGTGAYPGLSLPGLVGGGTGRPASSGTVRAAGTTSVRVAGTVLRCGDGTGGPAGGRDMEQVATYTVLPSGAAVFAAGTGAWACTLNATCTHPVDPRARRFAVQVTATVLHRFGHLRAG